MDLEFIKKELGLRIKSYRLNNNLTQEQFCSITDIEQSNLSNIENGKTYPGFTTLCTIIEKCDIEPNFLFDFLKATETKPNNIDYEILDILLTLPEKSKQSIKDVLLMINK